MSGRLPLYRSMHHPRALPADANTGLWYDKFCHRWALSPDRGGQRQWSLKATDNSNPKPEWIATVAGTRGDPRLLADTAERRERLLLAHDAAPLYYKTEGRFVTGLGRQHPVENGLTWHHTLGVPYLPGSSVKGLVRAWASQWLGADDDAQRICGPAVRTDACVGNVLFLDALPVVPVRLEADVMTPHYGPWYAEADKDHWPGDWHSPNPIPFLVVAAGQTFQFGLLPRDPAHRDDAQRAADWLQQALEAIGAGAKTGSGYGRFKVDRQRQPAADTLLAQQREQQRLAAILADRSPLAQELLRQAAAGQWGEPGDRTKTAFSGDLPAWLERLDAQPDADAITELAALVRTHYPGWFGKLSKLKPAQAERAMRLLALMARCGVTVK